MAKFKPDDDTTELENMEANPTRDELPEAVLFNLVLHISLHTEAVPTMV